MHASKYRPTIANFVLLVRERELSRFQFVILQCIFSREWGSSVVVKNPQTFAQFKHFSDEETVVFVTHKLQHERWSMMWRWCCSMVEATMHHISLLTTAKRRKNGWKKTQTMNVNCVIFYRWIIVVLSISPRRRSIW